MSETFIIHPNGTKANIYEQSVSRQLFGGKAPESVPVIPDNSVFNDIVYLDQYSILIFNVESFEYKGKSVIVFDITRNEKVSQFNFSDWESFDFISRPHGHYLVTVNALSGQGCRHNLLNKETCPFYIPRFKNEHTRYEIPAGEKIISSRGKKERIIDYWTPRTTISSDGKCLSISRNREALGEFDLDIDLDDDCRVYFN